MNNKIKYLLFIFGLAANLVLNPSAFANEDMLKGKDALASVKLETSKPDTGFVQQNHKVKTGSDEKKSVKEINDNFVPFDKELLILRPEYYSFSQDSSKNYKFNLPANILNFSSGVYIGSPIFTRNKQALYKGASEEDLDTTIGAAFKLVILNR